MKHNSSTVLAIVVIFLLGGTATFLAATASAQQSAPAVEATTPAAEAAPEDATALEPPIDELRKLIGKPAEVTFTVMTVGGRSNLYLNSMEEWRDPNCFTAMLMSEARDELKKLGTDEPFDDLIGRRVSCRGELELDRDRVRIVVTDFAKQFEFVDADAKAADSAEASAENKAAAKTSSTESPAAESSNSPAANAPYISPSPEELRASVGKELAVTFRVMNAGGRSHLYINSQKNFRQSDCFTAQVDPEAIKDLSALGLENPRMELIGKMLECRGKLQLNQNRLSIVVTDVKNQLQIVEEPAEEAVEESQPAAEPQAAP